MGSQRAACFQDSIAPICLASQNEDNTKDEMLESKPDDEALIDAHYANHAQARSYRRPQQTNMILSGRKCTVENRISNCRHASRIRLPTSPPKLTPT